MGMGGKNEEEMEGYIVLVPDCASAGLIFCSLVLDLQPGEIWMKEKKL